PEALRAGALAHHGLGRFERALEFLDEAIRLRPKFIDALNDRGNVLQALGRTFEAVSSYSAALQLEPARADILNNRGFCLARTRALPGCRQGFFRGSSNRARVCGSLVQQWQFALEAATAGGGSSGL